MIGFERNAQATEIADVLPEGVLAINGQVIERFELRILLDEFGCARLELGL